MGFRIKAFYRVKQLPIRSSTHRVDLLVHRGVAADLEDKKKIKKGWWGVSTRANSHTSFPGASHGLNVEWFFFLIFFHLLFSPFCKASTIHMKSPVKQTNEERNKQQTTTCYSGSCQLGQTPVPHPPRHSREAGGSLKRPQTQKKRRQFIYLANHGHACLHLPRIEVRVKELDCHQLRDLVLSTEHIDQPIQLHHAKVLTSLHTSHHFDLNTSVVIRSKDIIGGLEKKIILLHTLRCGWW